jgi:hypothetical protein
MPEDDMGEFEDDDAEEPSLDGCDRIPLDSDTDEDNDMVSTINKIIWVTLFLSPSPPRGAISEYLLLLSCICQHANMADLLSQRPNFTVFKESFSQGPCICFHGPL